MTRPTRSGSDTLPLQLFVERQLSQNDHKLLVKALLKHGASPSGNGHANKEIALMKMVAKLALYEEL